MPEFTNVYFKMSTGNGNLRGPWNKEPTFEVREGEPAVDGGDGMATVNLTALEDVSSTAVDLTNNAMQAYERMLGAALPRIDSLDFMREMESQWKTRA